MPIEFDRSIDEARLKSPLEEFERVTKPIERRVDPLTGRTTMVVESVFPRPDGDSNLEASIGDGADCLFCPERVEEVTPEYPDSIGFERGSRGQATSFPNLFPYAKHANVVVLTEDHFRAIGDLGRDRLEDGLSCGLEYLQAVADADDPRFASINMNLLPPSGSSVRHPHMQAIADDGGTNRQALVARCERTYHETNGRTYWADLLDRERDGDRYVGETGEIAWIAPFAPIGQWHVAGISDVNGLPDPDASVVADFATGIESVLEYYADLGLDAFNFGLRFDRSEPASRVVVDVVARPAFEERYVNDTFYFQTIHGQEIVDVAPETYAPEVAAHFA